MIRNRRDYNKHSVMLSNMYVFRFIMLVKTKAVNENFQRILNDVDVEYT